MTDPIFILLRDESTLRDLKEKNKIKGVFSSLEAAEEQIARSGLGADKWDIIETVPLSSALDAGKDSPQFFGRAWGRFIHRYGYRNTWQGRIGWGRISDENPPKDDPRVQEYLRLKAELGIR